MKIIHSLKLAFGLNDKCVCVFFLKKYLTWFSFNLYLVAGKKLEQNRTEVFKVFMFYFFWFYGIKKALYFARKTNFDWPSTFIFLVT